ncbi:hypothetical protein U1Q18_033042, partial [Sarracenia purpurea var. burkii]
EKRKSAKSSSDSSVHVLRSSVSVHVLPLRLIVCSRSSRACSCSSIEDFNFNFRLASCSITLDFDFGIRNRLRFSSCSIVLELFEDFDSHLGFCSISFGFGVPAAALLELEFSSKTDLLLFSEDSIGLEDRGLHSSASCGATNNQTSHSL